MKTPRSILKITLMILMSIFIYSNAWAVSYDIKEMTPEVKASLDARRARYEQLAVMKAQGKVGENNRGYLEALESGDGVRDVVDAENNDRKSIYKTIVGQNGLPADALATVEKVFAQVQRDKAASGDSLQDESGNWIKK